MKKQKDKYTIMGENIAMYIWERWKCDQAITEQSKLQISLLMKHNWSLARFKKLIDTKYMPDGLEALLREAYINVIEKQRKRAPKRTEVQA